MYFVLGLMLMLSLLLLLVYLCLLSLKSLVPTTCRVVTPTSHLHLCRKDPRGLVSVASVNHGDRTTVEKEFEVRVGDTDVSGVITIISNDSK